MACKIAAYDSALRRAEADYWAWSHASLSPKAWGEILYSVMPNKPDDLDGAAPETIVGGIRSLDDEECVAYRFVDGGRDSGGRPGRLVILFAVAPIRELQRHDPVMPLRWLTTLAADAMIGALAEPERLEFAVSGWPQKASIDTLQICHNVEEVYLESIEQAAQAFNLVASRRKPHPFDLTIDTRPGRQVIRLRVTSVLLFTDEELGIQRPSMPSDRQNADPVAKIPATSGTAGSSADFTGKAGALNVDKTGRPQGVGLILSLLVALLLATMAAVGIAVWVLDSPHNRKATPHPNAYDTTDLSQQILTFIHYSKVIRGREPTTQQVATHFFRGNTDQASRHLDQLQRQGRVEQYKRFPYLGDPLWRLKLTPDDIRSLPQLVQ